VVVVAVTVTATTVERLDTWRGTAPPLPLRRRRYWRGLMGWYFSETRDEMSSLKKDGGRAALDSTVVTACRVCRSPRAGGVICGRQEGVVLR
jgi:hypothetical protein